MKKFFLLIPLMCILFSSCIRVYPTEVGLRVHELGDNGGTIEILKEPGRYSIAGIGATDYFFPTTEQNYRWTEDEQEDYGSEKDEAVELQIDGNDCKLDIGIRFYIDNNNEEGLKHLVRRYPTSLEGVVDGLLYDLTRGAIKGEFENKSLDDVMNNLSSYIRGPIHEEVKTKAVEYAIHVVEVYDISGLKAPDTVMEAKKMTQQSTQKAIKAQQDAKEQLIRDSMKINSAKANAEVVRILNSEQPSDKVLKKLFIEKWNGELGHGNNSLILEKQ